MKLFKNKRGVSPLIATVLLIAFAVALGAVVMNWGRGYVESTAQFAQQKSDLAMQCSMEVRAKILTLDNVPQICYNSTHVKFTLENNGLTTLNQLQITLIGGNAVNTTLYTNLSLAQAEVKIFNVTYDNTTLGAIKQVRITPGTKSILCPESAVTVSGDNLLTC